MRLSELAKPNEERNGYYYAETYPLSLLSFDTKQILQDLSKAPKRRIVSPYYNSDIAYGSHGFNSMRKDSEYKITNGQYEIKNLDPHSLISDQQFVWTISILKMIRDPLLGIKDKNLYDRYSVVQQIDGKNYLLNGNHRAVAALYSNRSIQCMCVN